MITCRRCQSTNVKVNNGNFARTKPEGARSAVHTHNKYFFYCEQCENKWKSTSDEERDYFEYVRLRDHTTLVVRDVGKDGSYGPAQHIDSDELSRRTELAKKIDTSYKHLLDLDPGEWHEIESDSKLGS